jgi:hypothetical protein
MDDLALRAVIFANADIAREKDQDYPYLLVNINYKTSRFYKYSIVFKLWPIISRMFREIAGISYPSSLGIFYE